MGIRYLGYSEFILAGRVFRFGTFQRVLDAEFALETLAGELLTADSPTACWSAIQGHYAKLGFRAAHLQMNGVSYRDWKPDAAASEYWTIRIPFSANGFIELARDFRAADAQSCIAPLADLLHRTLAERLEGKPGEPAARAPKAT
jgi:hypothetical protein